MSLARLPIYLSQIPDAPSLAAGAGSGSGVLTYASSAVGRRSPLASGSGSLLFTGAAGGKRAPRATATGSLAYSGTATGKRTAKASSSGAFTFAGTATGKTTRRGAGAGAFTYAGSSTGKRAPKATGVGVFSLAGAAVGAKPAVALRQGAGTGAYAYLGAAAGEMSPLASGAGLQTRTGSAIGLAPSLDSAPPLDEGTPMPLATHTLTGDLSALIGERDKVSATIHLNTEDGNWVNETDGTIILGSGRLYYTRNGGTGEFSVTLPTSTGTGLQYEVRIDYTDETNKVKPQQSWRSGWFPLTTNSDLAERAANSSLFVPMARADVIEDRLDALEADSGTGDALALLDTQVNGYNDLGNVSGAVTINPVGTQVLAATGPTTLTIGTGSNGESFTIMIRGGGDNITWPGSVGFDHGAPTGDKITVTLIRVRGSWIDPAGSAGGGAEIPPVNDPPTQPGTVTVTPTNDGYTLSWVASTVAAGYEVQLDSDAWVDSGTDTAHAFTGLVSGSSHSGAVRAYNSLGARSTSRAWGPANVAVPPLHELLLSLEPEIYLRMTNGSLEDYSQVAGSWTHVSGATVTFDGPPLTPGDTSSANFGTGGTIGRPGSGLLVGGTTYTAVFITGIPTTATGDDSGSAMYFGSSLIHGDNWVSTGPHRKGGIHTWFSMYSAAEFPDFPSLEHRFFEAGTTPERRFSWSNTPPFTNSNPLQFVGDYYHSHIAVFKNTILDVATREAICTAAGTLDNAAGGGLA